MPGPDWLAANPFTQHGFTVRPVEEVVRHLVAAGLAVDVRQVTGGPTTAGEAPYNLLVCTRLTRRAHPPAASTDR